MASASDPIYVQVSYQTKSSNNTTRNDTFYMTSTLNAYSTALANNIATPVYNALIAEFNASGQLTGGAQYSTENDTYLGTAGGGPVTLRAEIGIGFQPLATPTRYHLVVHDILATPINAQLSVGGQVIYNWISAQLLRLTPVNLYQGVYFQ